MATRRITIPQRLIAVSAYQRYAYDIYLSWVDYLRVQYRTTALGLRKKRRKYPPPSSQRHPNWIKFHVPLATAHFWRPLPKSSIVTYEARYENEVKDPEEIDIVPPEDLLSHHAPRPDVPTLYQLSNIAFPLKWIHRKGEWTEEELKKIEDEEAVKSAWFWQYGEGKNRRKEA